MEAEARYSNIGLCLVDKIRLRGYLFQIYLWQHTNKTGSPAPNCPLTFLLPLTWEPVVAVKTSPSLLRWDDVGCDGDRGILHLF